jgi:single-strand DNA-binding protein
MAYSLNKVMLIGNLGRDPEIRYTQGGKMMATLSVATSESWKDAQGQKQERTEWNRVVVFAPQTAEFCQKYLTKGSKIYVEGKLQTRKWTDQQNQERYSTEVVIQAFGGQIIALDSRGGGGAAGGYAQPQSYGAQQGGGGYGPPNQGYTQPAQPGGGGYGAPPSGPGAGPPPERPAVAGGGPDFPNAPEFDDDIPF